MNGTDQVDSTWESRAAAGSVVIALQGTVGKRQEICDVMKGAFAQTLCKDNTRTVIRSMSVWLVKTNDKATGYAQPLQPNCNGESWLNPT
jgi:hypothetical protein